MLGVDDWMFRSWYFSGTRNVDPSVCVNDVCTNLSFTLLSKCIPVLNLIYFINSFDVHSDRNSFLYNKESDGKKDSKHVVVPLTVRKKTMN